MSSPLRSVFARFGIEFDQAGNLERGEAGVSGLIGQLQGLGAALAGGAIANAIRSFATETAAMGEEIAQTSATLGMTPADLQAWRAGAAAASISTEELGGAFTALTRALSGASEGADRPLAAFRRLGVEARTAQGAFRPMGELLPEIAEGLRGVDNPTERAALAMQVFGRSGNRLLPILQDGAAGVDAMRARFEELGGGLSDHAIAQANELDSALDDLDLTFLGLRSRIAVYVLPAVQTIAQGFVAVTRALQVLGERTALVQALLVTLGGVAVAAGARTVVAWVAAAAPFVVLAAVIAAAVLVVEDLIVAFEGGRSVIRDLALEFDSWVNRQEGWVDVLLAPWYVFQDVVTNIFEMIQRITGWGGPVIEPTHHTTGLAAQIGEAISPSAPTVSGFVADRRPREPTTREEFRALADPESPEVPTASAVQGALSPFLASLANAQASLQAAPEAAPRTAQAPQVTQTTNVRIDRIDANGLRAPEVEAVVTRSVRNAFAARDAQTVDDLGGRP